MSECGEDWETIQEAFALILDHAVQRLFDLFFFPLIIIIITFMGSL